MVEVEIHPCSIESEPELAWRRQPKLGDERRGSVAAAYRCWLRKRKVIHSSQPPDSFFSPKRHRPIFMASHRARGVRLLHAFDPQQPNQGPGVILSASRSLGPALDLETKSGRRSRREANESEAKTLGSARRRGWKTGIKVTGPLPTAGGVSPRTGERKFARCEPFSYADRRSRSSLRYTTPPTFCSFIPVR